MMRHVPDVRRRGVGLYAAVVMLWCVLAAMGSLLLLAVSNHITQNIAAVPLLWILPLAIYLFTFILCFDGRGWSIDRSPSPARSVPRRIPVPSSVTVRTSASAAAARRTVARLAAACRMALARASAPMR